MDSKKINDSETVESIIHEFNKQNADRIKDAAGQKVFQVNKNTGKVVSKIMSHILSESVVSTFRDSVPFLTKAISSQIPDGYYIVSNSNFVHRAAHVSDPISVQDKNGRKIDLSIRCEISCQPGNEEIAAIWLLTGGNRPKDNLDQFLKKCVYRFQEDIEVFISNFYNSNLPAQIEKFIMDQKDPSNPSNHITGLTFHSVKCLQINRREEVIPVNLENIKVGFKDSVERHSITLKCNLETDKTNNPAHWRDISKEEFEIIITENVKSIYYNSICESDSFNKSDIIENILKKGLNYSLQTYNREINNLELKDLYVETLISKSSFNFSLERKSYFTSDRERIELKIPLRVKIRDLMKLASYKKDVHLLKENLLGCADDAVNNFVRGINAGDFYEKIETDSAFQKSFVEEIRQKINNLIDAEVTIMDVDYGVIPSIVKTWTPFKAIVSEDTREFVITGSFSVFGNDISKAHIQKGQEITVEKVKEKIVETLEASFVRRYLNSSSKQYEKVARDLLSETVAEAFGVIIKVQNIKAEWTGLSFEDEAVIAEIKELKLRKIKIIANTGDYEKVRKLDERILMLEEYIGKDTRNLEKQSIYSAHPYNSFKSKENFLAGEIFGNHSTEEET